MSFYSKTLYREVAREWSTGLWIPGMIRLDSDIAEYIDNDAPQYVGQLPDITIAKGQASINAPQPYIIKDPDNGDPVMLIDTTGQVTSLDNSKAFILLTKNRLITHDGGKETRSLDLSEVGDATLNKELIYDWLESFKEWFAIVLYPFAVLASFTFRSSSMRWQDRSFCTALRSV